MIGNANQLTGLYMIRVSREQTIVNPFPNYYTQSKKKKNKQLFHINKNKVGLFNREYQKQKGTNRKVIKSYIQCKLTNIVKIGSEST